jgi:hypothetical protein
MDVYQTPSSEGGLRRQFIPARLEDNPSMTEQDTGYEDRLSGLGSEALVKAMRWGDWNVVEGAFFDCWRQDRHVIRPFEIPETWMRFRSGDWGSAKPFSFGWYAVVGETYRTADGMTLPRGCLIKYREWYGVVTDAEGKFTPDVGLKMFARAVGRGVRERDQGDLIAYGVLDPAAFSQDGGPSIAEEMMAGGSTFRAADNKRVTQRGAMGGWDQVRARLVGDDDGNPMLVFFSTCQHSIRTIPALQHDEDRPEDLDTSQEDHAADETRYACMSRPWVKKLPQPKAPEPPPGYMIMPPVEQPSSTRIRI